MAERQQPGGVKVEEKKKNLAFSSAVLLMLVVREEYLFYEKYYCFSFIQDHFNLSVKVYIGLILLGTPS